MALLTCTRTILIHFPRCHHCPIQPPVFPINPNFTLLVFLKITSVKQTYRDSSHSTFQIPCGHFQMLGSFQSISPSPRPCVTFPNMVNFYGKDLWASRPMLKMEGHSFSPVRNWFKILAATLHIRRPSPTSETSGWAISWWQGPNYHGR